MSEQDWRVKTALLQHRLAKFNPNHDAAGRFASAGGVGAGRGATPTRGGKRKPRTFLEGERVRMPNGVLATVRGAEGRIVEGAIADGDDGNTYLTAPEQDSYKQLGISTPRPVLVGSTR